MIIWFLIILIPVLVIVLSVEIVKSIFALVSRIRFYKKIKQICKTKNYKVIFPRKLLSSFFKYSDKPDVVIETLNENCLIRFITCKNKSLFYNFPTSEWYVSFERVLSVPINPTGRFKHLPAFDKKYNSDKESVENKCIMIFAPCMPKVQYLDCKNSKQEMAGNTANIGEWIVYDKEHFISAITK